MIMKSTKQNIKGGKKMKKLVLLLAIMLGITVFAAPEVSEKTKIVVIPFTDVTEGGYKAGEKLTSNISSKLVEMGRFEVVDRMELGKIMEEQKLAQTGLIDAAQAVEIGKIAGAKLAFTGNIVSLNVYREEIVKEKSADVGIFKVTREEKTYKKEWNAKVTVNVKLVDVETNVTLKSFTEEATFTTSDIHTEEAAIDGAILRVASDIMYGVKEIFAIKSYIISKNGNRATIRLGEDMGIKKQMEFYVFGKDQMVKDKFSNLEFKKEGEKKGLIIVQKVDYKSAEAKIVRGVSGVSEGDIIKEKPGMSLNTDFSLGVHPFKMDAVKANKVYYTRLERFVIDFEQDAMENALYLNFNFSPAYRSIRPTFDLNIVPGGSLVMFGGDINLEFAKELGERLELSAGLGIGGRYVTGKIGTVDEVKPYTVTDVIFDTGSELQEGADINLVGGALNLKAKGKVSLRLTEGTSVFGEYGYNIGSVNSWELETKDISDQDVKIGNAKLGKLDLGGTFVGGGIRLTF